MPVETEQDRLNMLNANDWGATLTLPNTTEIPCIADREFDALDIGEIGVESSNPIVSVSTADITGKLEEDDEIIIAGSPINGVDGTYTVKEIQHDGTGMSAVRLIDET